MTDIIFIALVSMITGQVWIILIQPDFLFDWMGKYIDVTMRWKKLHKLLTCSVCIAGQISLWWYPFAVPDYSIFGHFATVITAIWLTTVVNKIIFNQ